MSIPIDRSRVCPRPSNGVENVMQNVSIRGEFHSGDFFLLEAERSRLLWAVGALQLY